MLGSARQGESRSGQRESTYKQDPRTATRLTCSIGVANASRTSIDVVGCDATDVPGGDKRMPATESTRRCVGKIASTVDKLRCAAANAIDREITGVVVGGVVEIGNSSCLIVECSRPVDVKSSVVHGAGTSSSFSSSQSSSSDPVSGGRVGGFQSLRSQRRSRAASSVSPPRVRPARETRPSRRCRGRDERSCVARRGRSACRQRMRRRGGPKGGVSR